MSGVRPVPDKESGGGPIAREIPKKAGCASALAAPRARAIGDRADVRPVTYLPGLTERDRLAATLGATLRTLRTERGMGTRLLAARSAVARSTITRLEAGQRRPRRSLLSSLAFGLDPDDHRRLLDTLVEAAGSSLVPESQGSHRARRRAMEAGTLAGRVPMPSDLARRLALHQRADAAWRRAVAVTNDPASFDDPVVMAEATRLLDEVHRLSKAAGPPITIRLGGHEIRAGFRAL